MGIQRIIIINPILEEHISNISVHGIFMYRDGMINLCVIHRDMFAPLIGLNSLGK